MADGRAVELPRRAERMLSRLRRVGARLLVAVHGEHEESGLHTWRQQGAVGREWRGGKWSRCGKFERPR